MVLLAEHHTRSRSVRVCSYEVGTTLRPANELRRRALCIDSVVLEHSSQAFEDDLIVQAGYRGFGYIGAANLRAVLAWLQLWLRWRRFVDTGGQGLDVSETVVNGDVPHLMGPLFARFHVYGQIVRRAGRPSGIPHGVRSIQAKHFPIPLWNHESNYGIPSRDRFTPGVVEVCSDVAVDELNVA